MKSAPHLPPFAEVVRLAELVALDLPTIELARMYKHREFTDHVIDILWPKITARGRAYYKGLSTYEGRLCQPHNNTTRFVISHACTECNREKLAEYRQSHPEKAKVAHALWHQANRDYVNAYKRARRALKREQAA